LTFAKGGAPVMTEADLLPVIREVGEFALSGSRCTAEYDLPPRSVFCLFDPNQIGQVVENLMINSRQSMPDGGRISVSVSVVTLKETEKAGLQGGEYARIIFKDEGVGIPADALPRVFDPYFTTKQTGSGLGLATVWSIIKRHNGHIEIESSVGSGTTVTVFLPVTGHESKRNDDRLLTDSHGTGRILLMDDEEALLAYSLKVLSGAGFKPEGAGNGAEALRLFRKAWEEKASYKAVILDLTVPGGMNGVEVAEEIRKIDGTVPLLVVSGYSDDPVVANPSVYGFAASLSKPYQPKELIRLVNGVLSASG
jgi:CheY-like chemotaxis protein